jgi:hypothetical protein
MTFRYASSTHYLEQTIYHKDAELDRLDEEYGKISEDSSLEADVRDDRLTQLDARMTDIQDELFHLRTILATLREAEQE